MGKGVWWWYGGGGGVEGVEAARYGGDKINPIS